jgi:HK97 family phage prohead protease
MKKPPVLYREMAFDRAAVDEATRTVPVSFSSEARVLRQSWFLGDWTEILRHEPQAVDMSRLSDMGVLLYMHDIRMPIGSIMQPYLDENERKCKGKARFDADPQSDGVFQKVLSGTLRGISVRYQVPQDAWEVIKEGRFSSCGRFAGPCEIANRWTPLEVSVVTIPADATVGVGRSAGPDFELSEYMLGRVADVVSERIIKNIPFTIPPAPEPEPPPPESEPERSGAPPRIKIMRRKLELLSRVSTL